MSLAKVGLLLVAVAVVSAQHQHQQHPVETSNNNTVDWSDCHSVISSIAAHGSFRDFGGHVAHAIHSMTVDDLKKFKSDATVNNKVPTVSMDLRSEWALLNHAPESEPSPFTTDALQTLDRVLSHMDNPDYDVRGFTILERVVHAFHMREIWSMVQQEYETIAKGPTLHPAVCPCIRDIDHNGIRKAMRFIALGIREPGLVYDGDGGSIGGGNGGTDNSRGPSYSVPYNVVYNVTYHFLGAPDEEPLGSDDILKQSEDSMPGLTDEASWVKWKKLLTSMDPDAHRDTAFFLYCILNA